MSTSPVGRQDEDAAERMAARSWNAVAKYVVIRLARAVPLALAAWLLWHR
jgi:hypothetical protein